MIVNKQVIIIRQKRINWNSVIICIRKEYLKPYKYVQITCIRNTYLVSLFNGISTFVGYLIQKSSL